MIAIFEDNTFEQFYPFTLNHATFELRCHGLTMLDWIKFDNNMDDVILIVRDSIKNIVAERYPDAVINPEDIPDNYRKIHLSENKYFKKDDNLFSFSGVDFPVSYINSFKKGNPDKHQSCIMVNEDYIFISDSARISAGVILDASNGPIIIESNALIDIGALIKGPAYIGVNSIINPGAKLDCVDIGPDCKIGGEVEHTTFHGYSNKQHDGYLGNSYVGEWVNLGANTNNSDLKNNYSNIKVNLGNKIIDVGMFAGCLIGDYTKTGISTMINTGTYIGIGCNLFNSGFQDKYIPNFSWGKDGEKTDFNKFIRTLEIVKKRRNKKIDSTELEFLKKIYENKI